MPMLLQNSSVWQLIELQTLQGGQTTHFSGQASAANFVHSIVSPEFSPPLAMQPQKKIVAMQKIIANASLSLPIFFWLPRTFFKTAVFSAMQNFINSKFVILIDFYGNL
jgi:hypothetical protein